MTESHPGVSWLGRTVIRLYNATHRGRTGPFQPDQIKAKALAAAGAQEPIRDPDLDFALDAIIDSINRLPDLSPWGRTMLEGQLTGPIAMRQRVLSMTESDGPVAPVLFIIGPPRTGTTLLQRLMAEDPRSRSLRPWELNNPIPAPHAAEYETDERISRTRKQMRAVRLLAPGIHEMHPMEPELPEEDVAILSRGFLAATWCGFLGFDREFEEWVFANNEANAAAAYRYHRRELAYLQSDFAPTHWVLKSPAHVFGLSALLATYPDAWIVNTYREPVEWVASLCQLQWIYRSAVCRTDASALGDQVLRWWGTATDRMITLRQQNPGRFIDIDFRTVVRTPVETIRHIYHVTGLNYDEAVEERVSAYLARDTFLEHKTYRHSLEKFGLDRAAVENRFARYRAEFGLSEVPGGV